MWQGTVGLLNGQYKYLTAESFGHKINANGTAMKKKQQWSIELFPLEQGANGTSDELNEVDFVSIKSPLNCYLAVDTYGNVTCDSTERNDKCRFIITICSMSRGSSSEEQIYWAFKNVVRNYYLGAGADGMINCNAKIPQSRAELWHVHLQPAPGAACFALKSIGRKRYARSVVIENSSQIKVDSTAAWGEQTLFQFRYIDGGLYALFTADGQLLTQDGICLRVKSDSNLKFDSIPVSALFNVEFHSGYAAFRDHRGQYLASAGHASILKSRSASVSKDELFDLQPAPLQIALKAQFNGKWLSIKQGVDLTANQNEISEEHETFELQYLSESDEWLVLTKSGQYWAVAGSSVAANASDSKSATLFKLHWNEDGSCSWIVSSTSHSGKWICARKSGQLCIGSTSAPSDPVSFQLRLQNRSQLFLRPFNGSGFVGLKSTDGGKLECGRLAADAVKPIWDEPTPALGGCFLFMANNNRYWSLSDGNAIRADATTPACAQSWIIELRTASSIALRTADTGLYLSSNSQGQLQVQSSNPTSAFLWEF